MNKAKFKKSVSNRLKKLMLEEFLFWHEADASSVKAKEMFDKIWFSGYVAHKMEMQGKIEKILDL